jgi:hypothetical protein
MEKQLRSEQFSAWMASHFSKMGDAYRQIPGNEAVLIELLSGLDTPDHIKFILVDEQLQHTRTMLDAGFYQTDVSVKAVKPVKSVSELFNLVAGKYYLYYNGYLATVSETKLHSNPRYNRLITARILQLMLAEHIPGASQANSPVVDAMESTKFRFIPQIAPTDVFINIIPTSNRLSAVIGRSVALRNFKTELDEDMYINLTSSVIEPITWVEMVFNGKPRIGYITTPVPIDPASFVSDMERVIRSELFKFSGNLTDYGFAMNPTTIGFNSTK